MSAMDNVAPQPGNSSIVNSFSSASQVVSASDVEAEIVIPGKEYLARKPQLSTPLCDHCQNIAEKWDDLGPNAPLSHFSDEASFLGSASTCSLCAQFLVDGSFFVLERSSQKYQTLSNGQQERLVGLGYHKYLCAWLYAADPNQDYVPLLAAESSPNTRGGLPQVKEWLKECLCYHTECNISSNQPLPTRLIFLESNSPKLCLSKNIQTHITYATLSHCWGGANFKKLLSSNLQDFQEAIPPQALSKTFLDAIEVYRFLGFEYIWIDSLCIIQDDSDDWARESALMCNVYSGSSLNIAASAAEDGTIGLFQRRASTWRCQIQPTTTSILGNSRTLECYRPLVGEDFRESVLSKRGWVVQERALSHRTVHFAATQIYWECSAHGCCEIFPSKFVGDLLYHMPFTGHSISIDKWHSVVHEYSCCKLTYDKDKLVAISGLAQLVHSKSRDEHVVGLWRHQLVEQLCWSVCTPSTVRKYSQYIAPSWSWASLDTAPDGVIFPWYPPRFEGTYLKVEDIDIEFSTENRFGAVSSAVLRVECESLTVATLRYWSNGKPGLQIAGRKAKGLVLLDHVAAFDGDSMEVCLVLLTSDGAEHRGLILRKVNNGVPGRFERMGVFSSLTQPKKGKDEDKETLFWAMSKGVEMVGDEECVDVVLKDGKKRFVIDLI